MDRKGAAGKEDVPPVLHTHPETGREVLFVNDHDTLRFDGVTKGEGEPLMDNSIDRFQRGAARKTDDVIFVRLAQPFRRLERLGPAIFITITTPG